MGSDINYASKYSTEIDERFNLGSVTGNIINNNFEFDGVNSVYVYSADTTELQDYNMTGGSRYGTPEELGNHIQKMTLTQDKAFTFTIDARNNSDTLMTQHAGRCLQREIDEVIIPTIDKYRLAKLAENAGVIKNDVIFSDKFYDEFIHVNAELTDNLVPTTGRVAYISPQAHILIKTNSTYTGMGDKAFEVAQTGNAYKIDGVAICVVPSSYLPKGVLALITHPCALTSPVKLSEYKIHENPPGVNGWLVEGRVYYDAFVLNNKKNAIALINTKLEDDDEKNTSEDTTE